MCRAPKLPANVNSMIGSVTKSQEQGKRAYRKGTIHNEEQAKDEQASPASSVLLKLGKPVPNGGLITFVQSGVSNQAEDQDAHALLLFL